MRRMTELNDSPRLREAINTIPATVWSALPNGFDAYANKRLVE